MTGAAAAQAQAMVLSAADKKIVTDSYQRSLLDVARHERLAERRGGVAIEGEQQAATGRAIEAMHEEDRFAELRAQAIESSFGLPSTIVDVRAHEPQLIRPGAIAWEAVLACVQRA